jgi:drug/metabolite transporter (DMT)-like permease
VNGFSAGLLAVIAAVMYAASQVVFRRGLQGMALTAGMIVSLVFGLAVLLIASAIQGLQPIPSGALLWFVVAGLLAPGVGRLVSIAANHRLGPSTSTPIQSSVGPMVAITGGLLLLGEQVDLKRVVAVAMIVVGVWDLAFRRHGSPGNTTIGNGATGTPDWSRRWRFGLILAVAAGLAYGASDLMRKQGLNMFLAPVMAATLSVATSFLVWLIFAASSREIRSNLHVGPSMRWFALGGVFTAFAQLAQFSALSAGEAAGSNRAVSIAAAAT